MIGEAIPKVEYRTLLDIYLDICFYLQMFTMVITMVVYTCNENIILATCLNWFFFIVEFMAAIMFHQWMYYKVYNHDIDITHWVDASKLLMLDDGKKVEIELSKRGINAKLINSSRRGSFCASTDSNNIYNLEKIPLQQMIREHSDSSRDIMRASLEQSKSQRKTSLAVSLLRAVSINTWNQLHKSIDDGSFLTAMENEDHFLHFVSY